MGKGIYFQVKQASVSSANLQKVLEFKMPAPSPIRILDISLSPDTTFQGSGTFNLIIGGQTNETSGQPLPSALDIPTWSFQDEIVLPDGKKAKGLILNPGDTIEIFGACSSGTGILTAVVLGEVI